jgi:hypothetical protein
MQDRLYIDDLHLGQRFASKSHVMNRVELERFALDLGLEERELPKLGPQAGQAANGLFVAAITKKLLVEGGLPLAGGLVEVEGAVDWLRSVEPDDVLYAKLLTSAFLNLRATEASLHARSKRATKLTSWCKPFGQRIRVRRGVPSNGP